MFPAPAIVAAFGLFVGQPPATGRAESLKAIQDEHAKEWKEFGQAVRAGTAKPDADGRHPAWEEVRRRLAPRLRKLIDADPADAVALDAIVFLVSRVGADDAEPALHDLVIKHHLASDKVDALIRRSSAPAALLRAVADKSPHPRLRLWATYHLAENLHRTGEAKQAEPLLEALGRDPEAKKLGGYAAGTLADTAGRLLFEIRRLCVGQEVPEIAGADLDGKAMKLSESRGRATLVVFWATWCGPCMAMLPHERALIERHAGRPFALVGVNGDNLPDEQFQSTDAAGKVLDDSAKVKAAVEKHKISWRSFRNGQFGVGLEWNVRSWPMVYLVDHRGIIRGKWSGIPDEKELDAAVEKQVKAAEADKPADRR